MEDERVVAQILAGNRDAFRLLVLRYECPLFRFLGLLGFDRTACEDLAQQTFLSVFRALADFDPTRARFSTWLFAIAKRHAAHERERAHRRHETQSYREDAASFSNHPDPDPGAGAGPSSGGPNPAEAASVSQRVRSLHAALGTLPGELRSTFVLSQLEELTLEEVAGIENCPVGTVKSRIFRARERLRAALARMEAP